jgi:hypothetical protein
MLGLKSDYTLTTPKSFKHPEMTMTFEEEPSVVYNIRKRRDVALCSPDGRVAQLAEQVTLNH